MNKRLSIMSGKYRVLSSDGYLLLVFCGVCSLLLCDQLPSLYLLHCLLGLLGFICVVSWCCIRFKNTNVYKAGTYSVSAFFKIAWRMFVFFAAFLWAASHFSDHWQQQLPKEFEGKSIEVLGVIDDLPDVDFARNGFRFKVEQAQIKSLIGKRLQLSCYRCDLTLLPNQRWQLTVRLKRPHGYASWAAFDYEKFLFRQQVIATGYLRLKEDNILLDTQAQSSGLSAVNNLRWQIKHNLDQALDDHAPAKGIMAALMIGDKSFLSPSQRTAFQTTGVSHLMAISGLHVGLVFFAVSFLFKWLLMPFARIFYYIPRQTLVLFPALIAAVCYSALAGFAVSTQRAIIMLSVFVVCRLFAREVSLLRVLLMAAVIILIVDPFSILDAGFWLSCSAVLVIALYDLYKASRQVSKPTRMSLLRLQPMLWLGMMPLTVLLFGQVSLISPLVNLIAVPIFCMLLIPLVLFALVLYQLGLNSAYLYLLNGLAEVFDFVNQSLVWLGQRPFALYYPSLNMFYMALMLLVFLLGLILYRRLAKKVSAIVVILWLCLGLQLVVGLKATPLAYGDVEITLLDVGQGLSVVVESQNHVLVYDTGPAYASGFSTAQAVLLPFLRQRGITKIDMLVISHADNDHMGGYDALQQAFDIDLVVTSRPDKIPIAQQCTQGQTWQNSGVRFTMLSPGGDSPQGSNNNSCVLLVQNDRYRLLLTGDIERKAERYLLSSGQALQAHFMLVPHHGSKTSSSADFLDAVEPDLALLAAGYRSRYGHPHKKVMARYAQRNIQVVSTVNSGSITLKFNNKAWDIQAYRQLEKGFWQH